MRKRLTVLLCLLLLTACSNNRNEFVVVDMLRQQSAQEDLVFNGDFVFPLIDTYTFTNDYGAYEDGTGAHYGVDLHTTIGNKAFSVSSGVVVEAIDGARDNPIPSDYDDPPYANDSIRGNYVTVKSLVKGEELYFRYMHLKKGGVLVSVGQKVEAGDQLGEVGNSGFSWGAHLHFEVRRGLGPASRDTIDPKKYIYFGKVGEVIEPKNIKEAE